MSDWNTSQGWSNGANGAISGATTGLAVGGPIGAVAGGIIGGLGGLFGSGGDSESSKNRKEARRQFNVQDEYNKNRLQYTVKDAIKAGVNPVAALGTGAGHYSPTVSAGGGYDSSGGFDMPGVMNGIGNFVQQKQARQDRAIALESANLDLESKRLQNDILRQKLLTVSQPGIPFVGQKPAIQDLFVPFRNKDGKIVYRLNQDAVPDTDITNISTWQTVGDDPGSISKWLREVILPTEGSWNDRYLPGYAWGRKLLRGLGGY